MATPLFTPAPSAPFLSSKPFLKPAINTFLCHSSLSDQLQSLSLPLLKELTPESESENQSIVPPSSKPTWINPTKPKPAVISLNRQQKSPRNHNPSSLQSTLLSSLSSSLISTPHTDKFAFNYLLSEAFPSHPSHEDSLFLLNSLYRYPERCVLFLEYLKSIESFPLEPIHYNLVLKSLRTTAQWDPVEPIAREMLDNGPRPDNVTYSTIITTASRARRFDKAVEWFDRMYAAGVLPDEVTFSAVLHVYSHLGKKEEALILYERGRAAGWKPDQVAFAVLGKIFGNACDLDGILYVRDEMRRLGVQPNVVVYNTLINAAGRVKKPDLAKELFEEMCQSGLTPDARTFTALLKIYGKNRRGPDAMEVWSCMKENRWPMDLFLYNTVLTMCAELEMYRDAEKIFDEMKQTDQPQPDSWTYSVMLKVHCRQGQAEQACRMLFGEMPERGLEPNITCYTSLIRCLGNAGRIDDMVAVFSTLIERGIELDDWLCGCLLSTLAVCNGEEQMEMVLGCLEKANSKLVNLIRMLRDERIEFDTIKESFRLVLNSSPDNVRRPYCNCLIDICTNGPNFPSHRARELFRLGEKYNLYPKLHTRRSAEWSIDLRTLSVGAAKAAFGEWIESIAESVEEREFLPESFRVFTGFGRIKTSSVLTKVIRDYLEELGTPFRGQKEKTGSFVASKEDLIIWMQKTGVISASISI